MTPADRPSSDAPRIIGGAPTDDEIAAIVAVFGDLIAEQAVVHEQLEQAPAASTWTRTRRSLRGRAADRGVWGDLS